jgi:large subunit ribosomal protein L21
MFAVIKSGGRQYKVAVGETLEVNRLPVDVGDQVRFEEVLLISDADNTMVGNPLVSDALVLATATKQGRGPKLIVFKYKPKKRYRHKRGHRQELTFLTIDDIVANGKSLVTGEAPAFREKGAPVEEEEEALEVETGEAEATAEATPEETPAETPKVEPEKRSRRRRTARTEESASEKASEPAEE